MPTKIYETVEIALSNDKTITVKPLTIKNLKRFLEITKPFQDGTVRAETEVVDIFIKAGMLCMEQFYPDLANDQDLFENTVDLPTLMKILEVAGGLKLNDDDPNFQGANQDGTI